MDLYLFVVVLEKEDGENRLVYKDNGDPAVYTSSEKAWKFANTMSSRYSICDYTVKQKHFELELN